MNCPACQTSNPSGQKFCGACGHKLEAACRQCSALNPPHYQFCGECGAALAMGCAIALARSGLVTQADQKATQLLGLRHSEFQGKPFSLFVDRVDMVIFFSHWNELLSSGKKQSFELTLKHKEKKTICVSIACSIDNRSSGNANDFLLIVNEVTQNRLMSSQLQYQQDLLGLIFTTTDNISTVTRHHFDQSLEDALKKICLFTKADRCFIYSINRQLRSLEPACQWRQPSASPSVDTRESSRVPLRKIKRAMVRFLQEQAYVINDVAKLSPVERDELQAWHQADLGALMCHLIHSGKHPIAVIGVSKNSAIGDWPPECVALVKFFGQLVSDKLPIAAVAYPTIDDSDRPPENPATLKIAPETASPDNAGDIEKQHIKPHAAPPKIEQSAVGMRSVRPPRNLTDRGRPMLLEKLSGRQAAEQQAVFPRDDGLVLLTCPRCGFQESISVGRFDALGNAISVTCPCQKPFAAVLEQRRAFRKSVKLTGFFSLKSDVEPTITEGSIWGPMVVNDLSKSGLRFSSDRSDLVHCDDLLMVRFNLDNSNQALIHKPARVIATAGKQVGCRFEGDDSYDITLGFYFI
jgi:hypothetical protein